jgi:hypothetical protein
MELEVLNVCWSLRLGERGSISGTETHLFSVPRVDRLRGSTDVTKSRAVSAEIKRLKHHFLIYCWSSEGDWLLLPHPHTPSKRGDYAVRMKFSDNSCTWQSATSGRLPRRMLTLGFFRHSADILVENLGVCLPARPFDAFSAQESARTVH